MFFRNRERTRLHVPRIWISFFAVLVVSLFCMVFIDRAVLLLVHNELPAGWLEFFRWVTRLGKGGIWFSASFFAALSAYILSRFGKNGTASTMWLQVSRKSTFIFLSLATSGMLLNVAKTMIGRLRPKYFLHDALYGFDPFNFDLSMNSFPSGHSQTIWAAMVSLSLLFPRFRVLFLLFAALVAASRVFVSRHFVSDVLMGSYIGMLVTFCLYAWFVRKGYLEDSAEKPGSEPGF